MTSRTTTRAQHSATADVPAYTAERRNDAVGKVRLLEPARRPALVAAPPLLQAKLSVNRPGDRYEHEADRIAEQVLRLSAPGLTEEHEATGAVNRLVVHRLPATASSQAARPKVTPVIEAQIRSLQGGGQPLPDTVRAYFEPRLGYDFGDVRVHHDDRAARLTHVVQQGGHNNPGPHDVIRRKPAESAEQSAESAEDKSLEEIIDNVKVVWDNLESNNPAFKALVLDRIEAFAEQKWDELSGTEQEIAGSWGALTTATLAYAFLSNDNGRKMLEDVNLATPLTIIPYMPIKEISYKPATSAQASHQYQFKTVLTLEKIVEKIQEKHPDFPPLELDLEANWDFDRDMSNFTLIGGNLKLKLFKGLGLSIGKIIEPSPWPEYSFVPGIGPSIRPAGPSYGTAERPELARGSFQIMLTIDLATMDWSGFPKGLKDFFRRFR